MDMLERAARVLAEDAYDRQHCGLPTEPSREQFVSVMEASYRATARAILTAIREPSIAVVMAGANEVENGDGELHRRKWQAMIDAIIGDQ
ncbi:MAG: hypothetical protein ACTHNA_14030 [Sphingopyxis terrae]|uniref:hypothetical protein n=1 Tax=Sphingopyxis terrae TaxID=33052 RepID=UPI003F800F7A